MCRVVDGTVCSLQSTLWSPETQEFLTISAEGSQVQQVLRYSGHSSTPHFEVQRAPRYCTGSLGCSRLLGEVSSKVQRAHRCSGLTGAAGSQVQRAHRYSGL
jgi:hypothetical protein